MQPLNPMIPTGRLPTPDFAAARRRLRGIAWRTPVIEARFGEASKGKPSLGEAPAGPVRVALKLESLQRTGSFKVRGAANRILALSAGERRRGVVAASSGNHGRAVAEVASRLGIAATICVPDWADPLKVRAIAGAGAAVVRCTGGYDAAEERAAGIAAERGRALVHPFDDAAVIEGQGTVMAEIAEQVAGVEEVIVPLSGGGLAAGMALAARELDVRVVAVSASRAPVMVRSIEAGRPLSLPDRDTIASALSGGIGAPNRYTFAAVSRLVAGHVVVEECQVRAAVRTLFHRCRLVVEGGGAVGVAALRSGYRPRGRAAVVISGGNIDAAALAAVVC